MKNTLFLVLPALLAAPFLTFDGSAGSTTPSPAVAAPLEAGTFAIDGSHSWILFKTNHLGLGTAWGSFNKFEGSFVLDSENAEASSVAMKIDASSVDTKNKKRDDQMKGPDFFNAKEFPSITFTSSKVSGGGETFQVTGNLEMLGKKKEVTVTMTKVGEGDDPWGNYRAGFEGTFSIDRTEFGMDYMKDGIGSEVTLILAFEGLRQ